MKHLLLLLSIAAISCKHKETAKDYRPMVEVWDSTMIFNYYRERSSIMLYRDSVGKEMLFIPADTSYIEYYGERFYPRKPTATMKGGGNAKSVASLKFTSNMPLIGDLPSEWSRIIWRGDSISTRMVTLDDSGNIIFDSVIKRQNGVWYSDTAIRPKPRPIPDTVRPIIKSQKISNKRYNHVDSLIQYDDAKIVIYKGRNGKQKADTIFGEQTIIIKSVGVIIQTELILTEGKGYIPRSNAVPDTTKPKWIIINHVQ